MKIIYFCITLFVAFLSGILPIVHKVLLKKFQPMSLLIFSGFLYFMAILLLSLTQLDNLKKDFAKITQTDALYIGFGSIVCVFFANIMYYTSLEKHKSYLVSTIIDSAPMFTLFFAVLLLKEHVSLIGILGVFFVLLGVACICINDYMIEDFELNF
jgi:drug/metabolite transporter (DMT)-like permease